MGEELCTETSSDKLMDFFFFKVTHENSLEVPFKKWNWKGFPLCNLAMACFCFCVVAFSRLAGYTDLVNNTKSQRHGGFHKPMKWISDVPLFKTTASAPPLHCFYFWCVCCVFGVSDWHFSRQFLKKFWFWRPRHTLLFATSSAIIVQVRDQRWNSFDSDKPSEWAEPGPLGSPPERHDLHEDDDEDKTKTTKLAESSHYWRELRKEREREGAAEVCRQWEEV